ncbi:hypothetical protein Tco_0508560 [Tanacetum coccineum]|uniref:Uncharacterized protein n=1 Tax=Tanacetum coccineum TaxID=301880 RepID=A0ABQ4ZN42_9ASTR
MMSCCKLPSCERESNEQVKKEVILEQVRDKVPVILRRDDPHDEAHLRGEIVQKEGRKTSERMMNPTKQVTQDNHGKDTLTIDEAKLKKKAMNAKTR